MSGFFNPKGAGIIGSDVIKTSVAGAEIIPDAIATKGWTEGYELKQFSLLNNQACTISINGTTAIYLSAGQGINIDNSLLVTSVKIIESGITYNWIGVY
jgi:hypothetical protein